MKNYIGPSEIRTTDEWIELAVGTPLDLWLGQEGEDEGERAARLDAARDILADDPGLLDRTTRLAVETIAATMPELLRLVPPGGPTRPTGTRPTGRRRTRAGVAA
jgi:hypothetical protein